MTPDDLRHEARAVALWRESDVRGLRTRRRPRACLPLMLAAYAGLALAHIATLIDHAARALPAALGGPMLDQNQNLAHNPDDSFVSFSSAQINRAAARYSAIYVPPSPSSAIFSPPLFAGRGAASTTAVAAPANPAPAASRPRSAKPNTVTGLDLAAMIPLKFG